jgi:hypothetical protein
MVFNLPLLLPPGKPHSSSRFNSTMNFYQLFILVLLAFATSNALKPAYLSAILQDPANFPNLNLSSLFHEQDESNSNYSSHERRWAGPIPAPADDATWEAAKCKGRKFMAQMSYSDYDVGQMLPIPQISVQSPFSFSTYSLSPDRSHTND